MTSEARASDRLAVPLAHRLTEVADVSAAAGAVAAVWHDVDHALRPIIGPRGVVALFNRSVHLISAAYPWLAAARQDPVTELDLVALQQLFAQQSLAQAVNGGNGVLQAFAQLLASLIGAPLTERLLRPAWTPPLSDLPLWEQTP